MAARLFRVREPRPDQGAARHGVAGHHRPPQCPGHGGSRRDPGAARVQSAAARVLQADRAFAPGIITFNGHLEGLEQTRRLENVLVLTFRPQEAVYSLELLNVAFNEYFTTVAEYNRAQFELYHALGYPAREVTSLRPPGDDVPVDTARPPYLPPVGNGPPPQPDERWVSLWVAFVCGFEVVSRRVATQPSGTRNKHAESLARHEYIDEDSTMISLASGGGRLRLQAFAVALGFWVFSDSSAMAQDGGCVVTGQGREDDKGNKGPHVHGRSGYGTLGYGAPGLYPGFHGFGLGYHLGYGYGGDALGVGADGGYPLYGGPGYPHCEPRLRRIGGITPFPITAARAILPPTTPTTSVASALWSPTSWSSQSPPIVASRSRPPTMAPLPAVFRIPKHSSPRSRPAPRPVDHS